MILIPPILKVLSEVHINFKILGICKRKILSLPRKYFMRYRNIYIYIYQTRVQHVITNSAKNIQIYYFLANFLFPKNIHLGYVELISSMIT